MCDLENSGPTKDEQVYKALVMKGKRKLMAEGRPVHNFKKTKASFCPSPSPGVSLRLLNRGGSGGQAKRNGRSGKASKQDEPCGAKETPRLWWLAFNSHKSHEKEGGAPWNPRKWRFFIDFMESNSLVDLGFSGQCFTWEKNCGDNIIVRERLNRVLKNADWAKWAEDPACKDIIQSCWGGEITGSSITNRNRKLATYAKKLLQWSRNSGDNSRLQIKKLLFDLEMIQKNDGSLLNQNKKDRPKKDLDSLWKIEELYWC
ncbi:unnamed protein product [Prunus armeniaca]|uniref:DUF4283 domain-containing protein n=1 Tax=Prunus armeniaca TaxID=36596 RepID=A0A6J5XNP0_PRUAR|nr:unnamed protein product [Prunus armeniaca]